jgi:glycosyltransferase involved in cell wall biosynthesis
MALSVCIPTYKRPSLLLECINSLLASDIRPIEIVVSDDAPGAAVASRLAALQLPDDVTLRYIPNRNEGGQAGNVRNAFEHATCERIVLMHDDDFFLPHGLDALGAAWDRCAAGVDAVYGRVSYVTAAGEYSDADTHRMNRNAKRTGAGFPSSNLWAALVQQFPPNGMMLRRSVALAAGVPSERDVGVLPPDVHFGINYALASTRPFLLIEDYVSAYRKSDVSVGRPVGLLPLDGHLDYVRLQALETETPEEAEALENLRRRSARRAILGFIAHGRVPEAREVFRKYYRTMGGSWRLRLRVRVAMTGAALGIKWPHWFLAQRR